MKETEVENHVYSRNDRDKEKSTTIHPKTFSILSIDLIE